MVQRSVKYFLLLLRCFDVNSRQIVLPCFAVFVAYFLKIPMVNLGFHVSFGTFNIHRRQGNFYLEYLFLVQGEIQQILGRFFVLFSD